MNFSLQNKSRGTHQLQIDRPIFLVIKQWCHKVIIVESKRTIGRIQSRVYWLASVKAENEA